MADLSEEELQALYCWIDEIPLSRQKKNITRDFSDGGRIPVIRVYNINSKAIISVTLFPSEVLTAEIVHHFLPHLVELHNYSPANSSLQKMENWKTLNSKMKLFFHSQLKFFCLLSFFLRESVFQA